jgi:hypothetical protein
MFGSKKKHRHEQPEASLASMSELEALDDAEGDGQLDAGIVVLRQRSNVLVARRREGGLCCNDLEVLMTTFAIVIAMIPLMVASGAGASSHHSLGWVIFAGMSIGTCFTLFVVPVMYSYISKDRSASTAPQSASTTRAA